MQTAKRSPKTQNALTEFGKKRKSAPLRADLQDARQGVEIKDLRGTSCLAGNMNKDTCLTLQLDLSRLDRGESDRYGQ